MRLARVRTEDGPTTVMDGGDGIWRAVDRDLLELVEGSCCTAGDEAPFTPGAVLAPFRPPTIIGIGLNFRDTVAEMGWDLPDKPYLFPKLSSSATGPFDPIVVDPAVTTRADWEGELGVVIGSTTRDVGPDEALDHVFGYLAANDISARDVQATDGQWVRGKGLDTFCPLGPWICTADEIADPQRVPIRTWHNGRLVQDGTTASMVFGVAELISYCSRYFTLGPGDVILTGTPAGCGDFQDPPVALTPGDVVEVEVGPLGRQRNPVVGPSGVTK
ncbi:fumarylacetoacetate hydrolase family protein [Streptomyces sp. NPDC096311]|uniref:fumarylacetoacetate hydrolase family protein n=1 Tax=Streptomyces sp. NPDC096311 TaxID=3366083 RepID=UPI003817B9FA